MDDRLEQASRVLDSLRAGNPPWRYPHTRHPAFVMLFGRFGTSEPQPTGAVNYKEAERIIAATGARIRHHWRCQQPRYYRPPEARILLPPRSRFLDDRQYMATKFHEVLHHVEAPGHLGWVGPMDQGEMIAEVGTGFLESHLRLPPDQDMTNIMKWLPVWIERIEAKPAYLFDAVAQAERSVESILGLLPHRSLQAASTKVGVG